MTYMLVKFIVRKYYESVFQILDSLQDTEKDSNY